MGQSKQPAVCVKCGVVGPRRKAALKQGWWRQPGPEKPKWYCPEHAPAALETYTDKRDRELTKARATLRKFNLLSALAVSGGRRR